MPRLHKHHTRILDSSGRPPADGLLSPENSIMAEKRVSCDCGAVVRASTEAGLIEQVRQHAKEVHGMEMTDEQILAMAEPA